MIDLIVCPIKKSKDGWILSWILIDKNTPELTLNHLNPIRISFEPS